MKLPKKVMFGNYSSKIYFQDSIEERHRHRYEVNPERVDEFERAGLQV
jgi:CTP synthase